MIRAFIFAALAATGQARQTASDICVFNDAPVVLKWRLKDADTNQTSGQTVSYTSSEVHCINAAALGNVKTGTTLVPVIQAIEDEGIVWRRTQLTPADTVVYDPANVAEVTYVCRGSISNFSCKPGPPPLPAKNVTEDVYSFIKGFTVGLGKDIAFSACLQDVNQTYEDIRAIVAFFKAAFLSKASVEPGLLGSPPAAVQRAFELIGKVLKDFGYAMTLCAKAAKDDARHDAAQLAVRIQKLSEALTSDVMSVIKVNVQDSLHVYYKHKEVTDQCKEIASDWQAGDFNGSGKAEGEIVGTILGGLQNSDLVLV